MRTARQMLEDAFALHREGKVDSAEEIYGHLLAYMDEPDPNVLVAYGTLLAQQGRHGLAAHLLRQGVTVFPDHPSGWVNLSISLRNMGRKQAALFCAERAVQVEANDEHSWNALAGMYLNAGQPANAEEYARKAVAIDPEHPEARNNLALALLEQGKFDEAWPHYEYRWLVTEKLHTRRPWKCPQWDGKPVKFLAIQGEQAIGDEIMFMGCFAEARKRVQHVAIECTERLVGWFSASFGVPCYPNHAQLVQAEGEPDAYVTMGSMPHLLGMPTGQPYLKRYKQAIPRRIGLAWRGGVQKTNKKERSFQPELLRPILDLPGYEFVSVQYDGADDAAKIGLRHNIKDRDLEQIRDEIAQCELVITVCQSAVHMAGAQGVSCWVMTPKQCAWRYCGHPTKMVWYDGVTLFRQADDEKWEPVVARIADCLAPGDYAEASDAA